MFREIVEVVVVVWQSPTPSKKNDRVHRSKEFLENADRLKIDLMPESIDRLSGYLSLVAENLESHGANNLEDLVHLGRSPRAKVGNALFPGLKPFSNFNTPPCRLQV